MPLDSYIRCAWFSRFLVSSFDVALANGDGCHSVFQPLNYLTVMLVGQTRGFNHGRAIVISTCAAVAAILTGVLAGIFTLGEQLPPDSMARFLLLLGWYKPVICLIFLVILFTRFSRD